jgi:hypothetical protein
VVASETKKGHFLPDEAGFYRPRQRFGQKICTVWRKMDLFGPDGVPPNPLQTIKDADGTF